VNPEEERPQIEEGLGQQATGIMSRAVDNAGKHDTRKKKQ
jgi:hypothetical protein